ncbi:bacterioferritin [Polycladidibacter hongkongensis]|uniref:bacterioferritin n=1 Tax=Polycladidibacter hongkongensis TaxID=1647556 RepID=UPI00082C3A17|nr:bacterioferritin [Pseudovibrio hongkongensis]
MKDSEKVIERLNAALRHELGAVSMYRLHSQLLNEMGIGKLAAKELEEAVEEQEHADQLAERVLFLGGVPDMRPEFVPSMKDSVKAILEADLAGEKDAREAYRVSREICDAEGDYVSMQLFDQLLADEEGHIDFLETQLELLGSIGEANYGLLNAVAADAQA